MLTTLEGHEYAMTGFNNSLEEFVTEGGREDDLDHIEDLRCW